MAAIGLAPSPDHTVTKVAYPDVVVLRLEVDDLCTFPQCSTDFVFNFVMASQGQGGLALDSTSQ